MSVMDIDITSRTALTPAQARLALGMRHSSELVLRSFQGQDTFPVVTLHYDMVGTVLGFLGLSDSEREAFTRLASLPGDLVTDVLK